MPRGHKSKFRARDKRRQARDETKVLGGAQGTAAEEDDSSPSTSSFSGDSSQNLPTAGTRSTPKCPEGAAGVSGADSDEGAKGPNQEGPSSSQAIVNTRKDPVDENVISLVQFLMKKYYERAPITRADMLKSINRKYKHRLPEILKTASLQMELGFGVELKEMDPIRHHYIFFNRLDLTSDNVSVDEENMPKIGLLMLVLGVILTEGNSATEEKVWKVLSIMGVYPGTKHLIYGEPKKVITQDLVEMKYLEYQQVPNSDPPRYKFLWGPRAHVETTKMKVLELVAKIHNTTPSAFPSCYKEALKDEEERAQARMEARASSRAKARARSQAMLSSSSCPK